MFQSEQLQEKWAPLLNYDGLDEIKDNHRKAVTAVLLENQEKFLREQSDFAQSGSFLTEQPNQNTASTTNAPGFSGSATATGPAAGFDPVLISLIRRAMPNLVAYDLAGVQPMSGPTGLIFAMRSRYVGPPESAGGMAGNESFYNEADASYSGQDGGFDATSGMSDVRAGMGTTGFSERETASQNPAVLNLSLIHI